MKSIKFILTCFIATSITTGLSSCSDDDNEDPEMPKVKMGITSMEGGYINFHDGPNDLNGIVFSNVKYDSNGRIVSYTDDNEYSQYTITYTYEYSQDKITVKSQYGNDTDAPVDRVYNLKNGLIVSESENSISYNYNDQNQLNSYSDRYNTCTFTWNNGNPVSATIKEGADKYLVKYEYTSDINTLSCLQHGAYSVEYFDLCDPFLMAAGYFGQQPKNLIKSISDGDNYHNFSYSDFNENGYPCFMKVIDESGYIQEYKFSWEKI